MEQGEYREGGGNSIEARLVIWSLRRNTGAWSGMGGNDYILDVVRNGYKLPFIETPEPACFKNNRSALDEREFVESAIRELVEIGGVHECRTPTRVVNPLSVSIRNGKKRLILDLRYVNAHIWKDYCKFEDFTIFRNFLEKGDFLFSFDLKSGYHDIDIFKDHWEFLGFSWKGADGI